MDDVLKVADELEHYASGGDVDTAEDKMYERCEHIPVRVLNDWAARLSRYTPAETSEVRLLRELRDKAEAWRCDEDADCDSSSTLDVCEVLDALAELEGQNE